MLSGYYAKEYGKSSSDWYNLEADYALDKVKPRADRTLDLAKQYISYSSPLILEIGCAFGGTIWELRERGMEAYGSDLTPMPFPRARAWETATSSTVLPIMFLMR